MLSLKHTIIFSFLVSSSLCLPPHRRLADEEFDKLVEQEKHEKEQQQQQQHQPSAGNPPFLEELGIEYTRYLQQVIETLEKDVEFKKRLESANESDIRTAKIADELEFVNHNIRSKLDELKRTELERLRTLVRESNNVDIKLPGHIDHENPNTFEVKDFKKLIKQVALDLEEADNKRKQMFKEYEMQKHYERELAMRNMTEEQRTRFLHEEEEGRKLEEEAKKKIHHPGSKKQLEEVWVEQDHMSKNDFNPKTFFVMHDIDGNGFLDEEEVKTLFLKELDKLYVQGMPHADLMERAEEMERMREHVFLEMDRNRDRLISWQEFHDMSLRPEFNEDNGWDPIDEKKVYSPEEMAAFEKARKEYIDEMVRQGKMQPPYPYPVTDNHIGEQLHQVINKREHDRVKNLEQLDEYYKNRRDRDINQQYAYQSQGNGQPMQYAQHQPQYAQQHPQYAQPPVQQYAQQPQGQQYVQQNQQQFAQQAQQNQQFVQQPQQNQQQFVQQPQQNQQFVQQPQQNQQQFVQQPQQNQQFVQPPQGQQFAQQPQQNQQYAQQPQGQFAQPQQPYVQAQNQQQPSNKFQAPVDNAIPQSGVKDASKQPFEQHPNNLPK